MVLMIIKIFATACIFVMASATYLLLGRIAREHKNHSQKNILTSQIGISLSAGIIGATAFLTFGEHPTVISISSFFFFLLLIVWFSVESFRDIVAQSVPLNSMIGGTACCLFAILVVYTLMVYTMSDGEIVTIVPQKIELNPAYSLLAGSIAALFSGAFVFLSKRKGLGTADIAFFTVMGLVNGYPGTLNALYITVFSALAYGIAIAIQRKKIFGIRIPFIPFISFGTLAAFLLGKHALIAAFL